VSQGGSKRGSDEIQDLGANQERLSLILENLPVGIVVFDEELAVVTVNSRAETLLGRSRAQLLDLHAEDSSWVFCREDGKYLPHADHPGIRAAKSSTATGETILGIPRDGDSGMCWVLANAIPIHTQTGTLSQVVLSLVDLTEKRRLEEQERTLQKLEALGVLAGGIAHDFNNILGGLFGYLEAAQEVATAGDAQAAASFLEKSILPFERARALTRQLLTFAKGGAPVTRLERLQKTLKECTLRTLGGSDIKPVFLLQEDLWPARVDLSQIGQTITNLVQNARQAMPLGGKVEVRAENVVLLGCEGLSLPPGDYLRISVLDEGTGIPPDQLPRIFDPFYSTKQAGTGLGLSTAYSILNRHGGAIRVTSTLGTGTCVTIHLPASPTGFQPRKARVRTPLPALKGRHVLVMDDELPIRDVVTRMLTSLGLKVTTCAKGEEALRLAREAIENGTKFDLFLLDLTIPGGMGGRAVAEPLQRMNPDALLIASSGYSDDPIMADPSQFGFSASLAKPYTRGEMEKLMSSLLVQRT
jgi:PAS domain S-box-containing protein